MTRFIERDKKTQVNSSLIGVKVCHQVVPPTYEVNHLLANVSMKIFDCTNSSNGLPMVYVNYGSGDMVWAYTGEQEEYGGTVYNVWTCVMGSDTNTLLTDSNDTITDKTQFYFYESIPENPRVVAAFKSEYMLRLEGHLYHFDPNSEYWYVTDEDFVNNYLRGDSTCVLRNGFFYHPGTGRYLGQFTGDPYDENVNFTCAYKGDENGYAMWKIDYDYGEIYLYSSIRNPYVGYNLVSNNAGTEAYTSRVMEVYEDEVDPGYEEEINCSVEYSVDGENWTAWPENLTDDNNVIANIPRYMYLKFSQDVELTEE
jgi:hypothetical protein